MSKMGKENVFAGLIGTTSTPAPKTIHNQAEKASTVEQSKDSTPKAKKKKTSAENNLKRQTFWADQTQWEWIQDYAYTTRQSVMDTMYQIIEEFQARCEIEVESKPRRRRSKK